MGPLSFLNGAFLIALAAAAVPILIHLFSRRRAREVHFSHLAFLDEITRRRVRRMRLRQWLLLALRTLAIACAAFAMSRPVWHGAGARAQRGSSTVAILLDDSFSMEAALTNEAALPVDAARSGLEFPTRFEEARQRAMQVLDLLDENDRAVLVFTSRPLRMPYENPVRDLSLLREELRRVEPRATRTDLTAALDRIRPILADARTLNREVFVISDFQRADAREILSQRGEQEQRSDSTLTSAPGDTLRTAARLLPAGARLYLLPVHANERANVSLDRVFFERDPAGAGGRVTLRARNHGDRAAERTVWQVTAAESGADVLGEALVDLEAQAAGQFSISFASLPPNGLLAVRGGPDLLTRDNVRFVSASAAGRFKVLVVTGGSLDDARVREEAQFLLLAIDPEQAAGRSERRADSRSGAALLPEPGESPPGLFEARTVSESDFGLMARIDADVVILLNIGQLSRSAEELLDRHHAEGTPVLIAAGDRVDPRTYNTRILPRLGDVRFTNIIGDPSSATSWSLQPDASGHPILEGFPIAPGQALTSARFQRYLGVALGPRSRALAQFAAGQPALVEEPGLLVFTSSLDLRWSDFPTSASYLPFIHRALLHLVIGSQLSGRDPLVGEPLSWPLPDDAGNVGFHCVGPGGMDVPVRISQTDARPFWVTDPVYEPGFYRLEQDARGVLGAHAVNVDTRESDLTPMSPDEVALTFGDDATWLDPDARLDRRALSARFGRELWQLFLALSLGLLIGEALLARGRTVA